MDDFGLLNKEELSYIFHNEEFFGKKLVSLVNNYCESNNLSIDKIKRKNPHWDEVIQRISVNQKEDELIISKSQTAFRQDRNKYIFGSIVIVIISILGIRELFINKEFNFDDWYVLVVAIPFSLIFLSLMMLRLRENKVKSKQLRKIIITKSEKLIITENEEILMEDHIKAINLFWSGTQEIGNTPNTSLQLKISNRKSVEIDEENNHLELLRIGNEIAKFLNKKLNVLEGRSSFRNKIRF